MIRKKDADKNKDDNKKTDGESPAIVLKLDLRCHCQGCARKVKSSIRHIQGVESVNVDMAGNIITVTGEVDPTRVKERIKKKMIKKVEIVSPQVSATKEVQSSTVVLKILLHCQGCMDRIRRTVSKFKGVESAIPDASKDLIFVKGTMNVNELVPHLKQKFKRQVDVVLPNNDDKSDEKIDVKEVKFEGFGRKEKGNNGGDGEKKKDGEKYMKKDELNADASKSVSLTGFPFPTGFYGEKNKDEVKADESKSVKFKGVDKKEKENNGGDGEKKKGGGKDMKKDEVKAEVSKSVEFKGVDKKEKRHNGGDGEKKKDGEKYMKKDEVNADASKSVSLTGFPFPTQFYGEKNKDGDKDIKKDEVKADASKRVEVVNKLEYCGQNPFAYTMPMYNESYYNQDYGISTSNHGYENMGYANHGYAMQYSNGPPPPPPMYMHDSRGLDAGMFSDENPNAACSIM
ncbi:heavy metal-associated domain, HMA containing protein [Tanacetum coccineum]